MAIKIYVGSVNEPDYYFDDSTAFRVKTTQKVALIGKELTIDTFEPLVEDDINNLLDIYHFRSSEGHEIETANGEIYAIDVGDRATASGLITLEYGTPVWYYRDDTLVGKYFVSYVDRLARNQYQLHCISVIGLLDKMYHGGGLFQASTFQTVLNHILASDEHGTGDPVISYEIDDDVAELTVSGWLPRDTKRNNLYQLIFANGVNIIKSPSGDPHFTFLYTASSDATPIETEEIYDSGSVKYEKPYSKVSITEHTYTELLDQDAETLYDNTDSGTAVANEEIWFNNAPVIVSTITATEGLTIISATENSAIITGNGKLSGIPYTHTTRIISSTAESGDSEKTASVENCTLVNLINSENLLARLRAYYQPSDDMIRTIRNSIVYTEQRAGKAYSFENPFNESDTAFLASLDINASSIFKAECEWRANYEPAGQQGLYSECVRLVPYEDEETGEMVYGGTWTVPEGVTQFKVVMISGGSGGNSGYPGKNGDDATTYTYVSTDDNLESKWYGAEGGDGGEGGEGGQPGRVKVVTFENAVPGTEYAWTVGQGGEGGSATGFIPDTVDELRAALEAENPGTSYTDVQIEAMIAQEETDWAGTPNVGTAGTDSTFGEYSTADEDTYVPTGGVYEPRYSHYYALKGRTGISGGKGGARRVQSGSTYNWITDGEDVTGDDGTVYRGGSTGASITSVSGLSEAKIIAYGGNGAGAAVGIDREDSDYSHINGGSDQTTSWRVEVD